MSEAINEIKTRLPIENLVAEYVVLKRVGKSLKGLCPFHSEKTPSFIVSPDKGIAYCFGCHKGGDVFRFLMEVENIDFSEALKLLADKSGVVLEKQSSKSFVKRGEREVLLEIHEKTTSFYQEKLMGSGGVNALQYFHSRGINDDTIKRFRLGFAPDDFAETHQYLLKSGYTHAQILQSGLALAKDTSMNRIYDRFRGRVMFPVRDSMGRVVGFGGRALLPDQQPKYLNSPETPIYQKNQLLYGFYEAKKTIKAAKQAIIVEGYMDYLMAFQDGVKNVVAVNGTALSNRHLTQLKPYIEELVFSFDMDNAGREASRRSFELTQDFDFLVKGLVLTSGKDIADFVKEKPGELNGLLSGIKLFSDYYYEELFTRFDKNSLSDQRKILAEFAILVSRIKSSVERDSYVRKLAADLNVPEVQVYDEMNIMKFSKSHPAKQALEQNKPAQYSVENILVGLMLNYPKCFYDMKESISQELLPEKAKTIYNQLLSNYTPQGTDQDAVSAMLASLEEELKSEVSLMSLYVEEKYGELQEVSIKKEVEDLLMKLRNQRIVDWRQDLHKQLKDAESSGDQEKLKNILLELSNISEKK